MLWMSPGCCTMQKMCLNMLDCCTIRSLFTFSNRLILTKNNGSYKVFPSWTSVLLNKVKICTCIFLFVRPLADSEKLPVRSHRATETPKSPTEHGDAASQEPKKKSSKEKREKKKDKDRDRKVQLKLPFFIILLSSWKPHSPHSVELLKLLS